MQNTIGVFWPPLAPVLSKEELSANNGWWVVTCIVNVIPVTAMLHHGVCYYQRCMFQPFSVAYETTGDVLWKWVRCDPSLPWAIIFMFFVYGIGRRFTGLKILVAPLFLSFSFVSLWVWDIAVLGRPICRHFHDGRFEIWEGFPLRGSHFYVLGACLHVAFTVYLLMQYQRPKPEGQTER